MPITFVNFPRDIKPVVYEQAIDQVITHLRGVDGIVSIYQIGSVSAPGISDIDLLVVFEDEAVASGNPIAHLTGDERYLFTHGLFGVCRRDFHRGQRYTFYHNYVLRWGEDLRVGKSDLEADEVARIKRQIALEFLIANYISKTVDRTYRLVSVRNLLLSVKALRYDMEYLGVTDGELYDLINQLILWREAWFEQPVGKDMLREWFESFYSALHLFLTARFNHQRFFLPAWATSRYARHICLERSHRLSWRHKGIVMPLGRRPLGKKYTKLNNRLNRFIFSIPITDQSSKMLEERFLFLKSMKRHNESHLASFAPLGSVLASRLVG